MKKKTMFYLGGAVLLAVAAYQTKKKVQAAIVESAIEARTATENAIIAADNTMLGIPSALGKWWMVDILQVWPDDAPTNSYNWLEGSDGSWPGI